MKLLGLTILLLLSLQSCNLIRVGENYVSNDPTLNKLPDAYIAYAKNDFDDAIAITDENLKVFPNSSANYYLRSLIFFRQNHYNLAIAAIDEAIERCPECFWYYEHKFFILNSLSDFAQAREVTLKQIDIRKKFSLYKRLIDLDKKINNPWFLYQDAIMAIELFGYEDTFVNAVFDSFLANFDRDRFFDFTSAYFDEEGFYAKSCHTVGSQMIRLGLYDEAKALTDSCIRTDCANGRVYFLAGYIDLVKGDKKSALDKYLKGIDDNSFPFKDKMAIFVATQDYNPADYFTQAMLDTLHQELIAVYPEESQAYALYGQFLIFYGRSQKGYEMLKKAYQIDSSDIKLVKLLLDISRLHKDYDFFSQLVASVEDIYIFDPLIQWYVALDKYFKKQYPQAVKIAENAISFTNDITLKNRLLSVKANSLFAMADFDAAFAILSDLKKTGLDKNSYINYLFLSVYYGQNYHKVLDKLENNLLAENDYIIYILTYALAYSRLGDDHKFSIFIDKAMLLDDKSPFLFFVLYDHYQNSDHDLAKKYFDLFNKYKNQWHE